MAKKKSGGGGLAPNRMGNLYNGPLNPLRGGVSKSGGGVGSASNPLQGGVSQNVPGGGTSWSPIGWQGQPPTAPIPIGPQAGVTDTTTSASTWIPTSPNTPKKGKPLEWYQKKYGKDTGVYIHGINEGWDKPTPATPPSTPTGDSGGDGGDGPPKTPNFTFTVKKGHPTTPGATVGSQGPTGQTGAKGDPGQPGQIDTTGSNVGGGKGTPDDPFKTGAQVDVPGGGWTPPSPPISNNPINPQPINNNGIIDSYNTNTNTTNNNNNTYNAGAEYNTTNGGATTNNNTTNNNTTLTGGVETNTTNSNIDNSVFNAGATTNITNNDNSKKENNTIGGQQQQNNYYSGSAASATPIAPPLPSQSWNKQAPTNFNPAQTPPINSIASQYKDYNFNTNPIQQTQNTPFQAPSYNQAQYTPPLPFNSGLGQYNQSNNQQQNSNPWSQTTPWANQSITQRPQMGMSRIRY